MLYVCTVYRPMVFLWVTEGVNWCTHNCPPKGWWCHQRCEQLNERNLRIIRDTPPRQETVQDDDKILHAYSVALLTGSSDHMYFFQLATSCPGQRPLARRCVFARPLLPPPKDSLSLGSKGISLWMTRGKFYVGTRTMNCSLWSWFTCSRKLGCEQGTDPQ